MADEIDRHLGVLICGTALAPGTTVIITEQTVRFEQRHIGDVTNHRRLTSKGCFRLDVTKPNRQIGREILANQLQHRYFRVSVKLNISIENMITKILVFNFFKS